MDGGAWWTAVHGVSKSQTRLSDFTFTFHFHALEKEMATHSSVLAWRIPGTGEPGGLPSMGSHRVRHDWSALAAAAYTHSICLIFPGFRGISCCGRWHEWESCSLGFPLEFYFWQSLAQWWLFLTSILHAFSFVYKGYFTLCTRV